MNLIATIDLCPMVYDKFDNELKIFLHKRSNEKEPDFGKYALVGGFVRVEDTNINHAIYRIAKSKITNVLQVQENVLKNIDLNDDFANPDLIVGNGVRDSRAWSISQIYALPLSIDIKKVMLNQSDDKEKWFSLNEIKMLELAFDHNKIIDRLIDSIKNKAKIHFEYTLEMAAIMLSAYQHFTLTELQTAYETITQEKMDKKTFRRKAEEIHFIQKANGEKLLGLKARPAQLYQFKK